MDLVSLSLPLSGEGAPEGEDVHDIRHDWQWAGTDGHGANEIHSQLLQDLFP